MFFQSALIEKRLFNLYFLSHRSLPSSLDSEMNFVLSDNSFVLFSLCDKCGNYIQFRIWIDCDDIRILNPDFPKKLFSAELPDHSVFLNRCCCSIRIYLFEDSEIPSPVCAGSIGGYLSFCGLKENDLLQFLHPFSSDQVSCFLVHFFLVTIE